MQKNSILMEGIFLISILFFSLIITTVLFIFKIPINNLNMLLTIICSIIITFVFSNKSVKQTVIIVFIGLVIILSCVCICGYVYDNGWDSNAYHKTMTGLLKNGWNPLEKTFYTFADAEFPFIKTTETWFDAYPKGTEIWGACVYVLTNNIETGKSFNIIAIIALFCICYAFLVETNKLKNWQSICCSLFLALNPVTLSQCFTYYNDGFLAQMLLLCCISLLYLTFYEKGIYRKLCWYFVFVSINIGFNVKFSAIIFFAILCLSFFCYWIIEKIKRDGFEKDSIIYFKSAFFYFVISVLSGTLFTGTTSYVINTIRYKNPVYTMIGEGSTEMITSQLPVVFREISNIGRFMGSLFSRTNTKMALESIEWKIPLMFNANEFYSAQDCSVRTAGWGIFFSGILLISFMILIAYLINKNSPKKLKQITVILMSVFFMSVCIVPGLSWARYCVVLFWIPVAALIYIFLELNQSKMNRQGMATISGVVLILLFLNMVPNIEKTYLAFNEYEYTRKQLIQFKILTENNKIKVGQKMANNGNYSFYGRFFNLFDMNINRFVQGEIDLTHCTGKLFNGYEIYYDIIDGIAITKSLEEFLDCLEQWNDYLLLIAVKDDATKSLKEDIIQQMWGLELKFELKDHYRWGYLALIDSGKVIYEDMSDQEISLDTTIRETNISMRSAGYLKGNIASIRLNGIEYALNKRGLNIVLYDKKSGNVIDSICIDTFNDNSLTRNL